MAKPKYKPLIFPVAMRNNVRLRQKMFVLNRYSGQVLDDTLVTEIVKECARYGIYSPKKRLDSVKDTALARNTHYRFATIFDICKELGFAYYAPNEVIFISELGHLLIDNMEVFEDKNLLMVKEDITKYETDVFLQVFVKWQRKNPFGGVLNDNVPLLLLLDTIKLLNADSEFNGYGISRKELPILIFWKDKDAKALYERIKRLRKEHCYNPSDETIIDICIDEIMEGKYKSCKPECIMREYPDEFIRKMRMTGLISLRERGSFIDINHNEDSKVEYILEHYSVYKYFTDERAYFDYVATIDYNLFSA